MLNPRTVLAASLAALTTGLVGATLVYGGSSEPEKTFRLVTDRAPAEERSLAARAVSPNGEAATLVYRNKDGERCFAMGRPDGDRIRSLARGSDLEVPVSEVGSCSLNLDPVALQIAQTPGSTILYGVAADGITRISVKATNATLTTAPAADDGFIVATSEKLSGRLVLTADFADGTSKSLVIGELPDLAEISEGARRNAPKPGEDVPPASHGG